MLRIKTIEIFNDCKEGTITMKSSFLITILVTAMTASVASAQINPTRPSSKDMKAQKSTFEKFSERLKIGYSNVVTTPTMRDIKEGNWENGALHEDYAGNVQNRDTWPASVWHQVSFNYNFGAKLNFVVNPRFMTPLVNSVDMKFPEDNSFLMVDDTLVGFQGVIFTNEDKKFNFWVRPAMRLPTSRASRNTGNGGAGSTTHQLDLSYNATYDFNKTWQVGLYNQFRQWVIEDHYDMTRFRIYFSPFVQYTIDDVSRVLFYYENYQETDKRDQPVGDRDPVFYDLTQNVFVGYSYDITPKFNVMPTVNYFLNQPLSDRAVWFGAQMSYSIK